MDAIVFLLLACAAAAYLFWRWKARPVTSFADRLCPHCRPAIRASATACPLCSQRSDQLRRPSAAPTRLDGPRAEPKVTGTDAPPGGAGAAFAAGALVGALWPRRDVDPEGQRGVAPEGLGGDFLDLEDLTDDEDSGVFGMRRLAELDDLHDARDQDDFTGMEEENEDLVDERADDRLDDDVLDGELEDLDLW